MGRLRVALVAVSMCIAGGAADLLVVENGLTPWPSGHGEDPPPIGSLVRLDAATGTRHLVAGGLVDPVWVVGSSDGLFGYVGLFHSGEVVRVSLRNGSVTTVARGLSCPEGVALDAQGDLFVVENPVGDECKATFPRKAAAQLTSIRLGGTGAPYTKIADLRSSTGGDEGGPHGLAVLGDAAFVCECPAGAAALTRITLSSGAKTTVANLTSPSGCAVDANGTYAYVVEQGTTDGQLVRVTLADGDGPASKAGTKKVLLADLAGPMGVAVDTLAGYVYVEERHKNRVQRVGLADGKAAVFATGLNSPIGLGVVGRAPLY